MKGDAYECNICGSRLNKFVRQDDHRICPGCGSIGRTRRLWQVLQDYLQQGMSILDFSPSRSIHKKIKNLDLNYISSDLSGDFISDVSFNICDIDSNSGSFDLIICYHILEHVSDDSKAMSELYRVLKSGGKCIVQTPFKTGEIYEDSSIISPIERQKHFGQSDHVRIYSIPGLIQRLENAGFVTQQYKFKEPPDNRFGFDTEETIIVCNKA